MKRFGRALWRLLVFFAIAAAAFGDFLRMVISAGGQPSARERAAWLHRTTRRLVHGWKIKLRTSGKFPATGLIVSNHLSYLDILLFCSIAPCTFVSKAEVQRWPVIGLAARLAGTTFVKRESFRSAPGVNNQIEQTLLGGVPVILFAEGTSTDGSSVLPFRSPMMESAVRLHAPITPACVSYQLEEGSVKWDICYWGDMTFVPHILKLFTRKGISASVSFAEPLCGHPDRKQAAVLARESVMRLLQSSEAAPRGNSSAGEL